MSSPVTHGGGAFAAAMWPGLWLSGVLAVLAFALSFSALSAVGVASGIDPRLGWAFPLIIDGFILLATWAAWRFRAQGLRGAWYPWAAFVVFSAVSMTGNALHAHPVEVNGLLLAGWAATAFSTVPSIALLVASHMLLMIATARVAPRNSGAHAVHGERVVESAGERDGAASSDPVQVSPMTDPAPAGVPPRPSGRPVRASSSVPSGQGRPTEGDRVPTPARNGHEALRAGVEVAVRPRALTLVRQSAALATAPDLVVLEQPQVPTASTVSAAGSPVADWVAARVADGLPVTGRELVSAGLATSESTARRWLRELRAVDPGVFVGQRR
jgi:hypothetical protein